MLRNPAIAIMSLCAVSIGSPAWAQNSPDEDKPPPVEYQGEPSDFAQYQNTCKELQKKSGNGFCWGDVARSLFKQLGKNTPPRTTQDGKWLKRESAQGFLQCWARNDNDGDPVVSMIYACRVRNQ
jgi:hypothetical protein